MARDSQPISTPASFEPPRHHHHRSTTQRTSPSSHRSPRSVYRHDPYRVNVAPEGTLHTALWGKVTFVPYPTSSFRPPVSPPPERDLMKVFIGQLPYFVTEMQLEWLCFMLSGQLLVHPEPIKKRRPDTGELCPTGCVYGYANAKAFDVLVEGLHKRTLVDDTGVWHAQTSGEFERLSQYVASMKNDRALRPHHRPYDTVVVQLANSEHHDHARTASASASASAVASPPPPSYEASLSQLPPPYFGDSHQSHNSIPASSPIVPHP